MKKQLKTKLSLNKETVARLNDEQMELVAGGQAIGADATIVIGLDLANGAGEEDTCGKKSVVNSKTCPASATCNCPGC
ncbi:class I lanthipeptide [Pedobacter roseus]|uniref:Class I lanthipeptide n=1 Tax=Pedobacter roseus TaxID=336820 RepID=A0A7G9QDV0_9SPHI|nr:class I lanthipeptide [Pedobacter roseus]QNN41525.1 class I lanthipeptide [Pedobacter roseus]